MDKITETNNVKTLPNDKGTIVLTTLCYDEFVEEYEPEKSLDEQQTVMIDISLVLLGSKTKKEWEAIMEEGMAKMEDAEVQGLTHLKVMEFQKRLEVVLGLVHNKDTKMKQVGHNLFLFTTKTFSR